MFGVLLRFREGPLATHGVIVDDSSGDDLAVDPAMGQLDPGNPSDRDQIFKLLRQSLEKVEVKEKAPKKETKKKDCGTKENPAEKQHYNEEYFDSFQTLEEAKRTVGKVVRFHRQAGSVCGNFITNNGALKRTVTKEYLGEIIGTAQTRWINECDSFEGNLVDIYWDTKDDFLDHRIRIKKSFDFGNLPSRREVLELISRLNDPLGLMSNTTINLRVLLQELQKPSASWDGQITGRSKLLWNTWLAKVGVAGYATIPRSLTKGRETKHQLNVFVGGSDQAIAACVYLRSSSDNEQRISVGLAAATTEVAPLQSNQSVLRLEFRAAELGTQLAKKVQDEMRLKIDETNLWTSSPIMLDWIRNPRRQYRAFVKEQIGQILRLTKAEHWRFTPFDQNPAQSATTSKM